MGIKIKLSLDFLTLELGLPLQPLRQPYRNYDKWVTFSWFKTLWKKWDMLNVAVDFHETPLDLAREGYKWIMIEFERIGYSMHLLHMLNRVIIYMQVLFLADVLGDSRKIWTKII